MTKKMPKSVQRRLCTQVLEKLEYDKEDSKLEENLKIVVQSKLTKYHKFAKKDIRPTLSKNRAKWLNMSAANKCVEVVQGLIDFKPEQMESHRVHGKALIHETAEVISGVSQVKKEEPK